MDPLRASAAAAIGVGLILYVAGLARPIWRSATLVLLSTFAGYYAYQMHVKEGVCAKTEENKGGIQSK